MKKLIKKLMAGILAFAIFVPSIGYASVDNKTNEITYIHGVALNQEQISSVAKTLGLEIDKVKVGSVNGKDLQKYVGYEGLDSNMISSVSVKKLEKGSGIKINILTPSNITSVTESQYTNAAITAGITDAEINVASPSIVTGESALVGVYKAVELNGLNVDTQRTKVAQDELATLKEVSEENKNDKKFDQEKLDKVVIDVKQNLAKHKEENGGNLADNSEIESIIKDSLNNFQMGDVLSNNNIQVLINYFQKYQNTDAIDSKEVANNLSKLAGQIKDGATKIYEDNKDQIDKMAEDAKKSGLWDQIVNFLKSLLNSITSMFDSSSKSDNQ